MNKKELKEFNKKFNIGNENQGIIFTDDSGVKRAIPLLVVRNFISQIKTNQRKKFIKKIKILQSANTEFDIRLTRKEALAKNDAFEEVLPEEKEGQFSLSDTELSGNKFLSNEEMGFNHAIKQIKQNAKRN